MVLRQKNNADDSKHYLQVAYSGTHEGHFAHLKGPFYLRYLN